MEKVPRHLIGLSPNRVVLLVAAIAIVYFLANGVMPAVRSYQLGQEGERLEEELGQAQERYRRLEALRDYLNSDEYIEAVAREQLGLVRPGERSIVGVAAAPTATPVPEEEEEEAGRELWWESLLRP